MREVWGCQSTGEFLVFAAARHPSALLDEMQSTHPSNRRLSSFVRAAAAAAAAAATCLSGVSAPDVFERGRVLLALRIWPLIVS